MLRPHLLLLTALALPACGAASVQDAGTPVGPVESAPCEATAAKDPAAAAATPADAPARRTEPAAARPAAASHPAPSRPALPRWNRLLPGMFR
jgi:hypothetical protein